MQEQERLNVLRANVPDLFAPQRKLLYVGASPKRMQCGAALAGLYEITLLEIWPAYAEAYRPGSSNPLARLVSHVVVGDVRDVDELDLPHAHYDVAFWWHGPSHIPEEDHVATLDKLEALADLVVLGSPWGRYEQEPVDGNPHQAHASTLYPKLLEQMGYETATLGHVDEKGSCIIAWKKVTRRKGKRKAEEWPEES